MADFPAQVENRRWFTLNTIQEHQSIVADLLSSAVETEFETCAMLLNSLYKTESDALMQDEGIFTPEQRKYIYEALT